MVAIFFLLSVFERSGKGTFPLPIHAYMFMQNWTHPKMACQEEDYWLSVIFYSRILVFSGASLLTVVNWFVNMYVRNWGPTRNYKIRKGGPRKKCKIRKGGPRKKYVCKVGGCQKFFLSSPLYFFLEQPLEGWAHFNVKLHF